MTSSEQYFKLRREIYDFVAEVCENVNSIAFNFLNQGSLTEKEAKVFASKNILANVQCILTEVKKKFNEAQVTNNQQSERLLVDLTRCIDDQLKQILSQLKDYYPQAPVTGGTARMREVIADINRLQDENYDLIFANQIDIRKHLTFDQKGNLMNQDPQQYTGFIMEVINVAINITREPFSAQSDQTVFEKFHEFSERLFQIGQNNSISVVIDKVNSKQKIDDLKIAGSLRSQVVNYFARLFDPRTKTHSQINPHFLQSNLKQQSFQQMRSHNKYKITHKIPNHVKPFGLTDLKQNNFYVDSSSVLRIMTKWAEYLQEIFQKPEIHIKQRVYYFKVLEFTLRHGSQDEKIGLCNRLKEQYVEVKKMVREMQGSNVLFQSFILSQAETTTSYLKRFTSVRSASAQINSILVQFTRKYLCILIHHLMKIGDWRQGKDSRLNLVVFRVGDLLRSKLQCSESSFINILNLLSILDQAQEMKGKFKLVRIKNKLNMSDNNVLLNYMLLGKVQCELQLSIQNMEKKDKNYHAFRHFLYQITRGKFGVLSQCAIIISQYDPIVKAHSNGYYRPKHYQKAQEGKQPFYHSIQTKNGNIYKCWKCHRLIIRENVQVFSQSESSCNQCIAKGEDPETKLRLPAWTQFLSKGLSEKKLRRVKNYNEIQSGEYVLSICNKKVKDIIKVFKVWKHQRELKLFFVELNTRVLNQFKRQQFDFSTIDYFDISSRKESNIEIKELTYLFEESSNEIAFLLRNLNIDNAQRTNEFIQEFERFRIEKNLIKTLKFKSQILDLRKDKLKLQILEKVAVAYGENRKEILRYKKCNVLEGKYIKSINLDGLGLEKEPPFLKYAEQCSQIFLSDSALSDISLQAKPKLQLLLLNSNRIKHIDLSKNPKLIILKLQGNQLAAIDLSSNIHLQTLAVSNNQITEINLDNNKELSSLEMDGNCLKAIDLGNNRNLSYLYLSKNQLTQIDLSKNKNLIDFDLSENQLKSASFWHLLTLSPKVPYAFCNQFSESCRIQIICNKQELPNSMQFQRILRQQNPTPEMRIKALSFVYISVCIVYGDDLVKIYSAEEKNIYDCIYSYELKPGQYDEKIHKDFIRMVRTRRVIINNYPLSHYKLFQ